MEIPSRIGKYKMLKTLGHGATGWVIKAEQETIHRVVALKMLFPYLIAEKPNLIRRFKSEARLAASLVHPNIVPIFEIGEDQGYHYYTMQYVEGVLLSEAIQKRMPFTFKERLEIFMALADAMVLAHRKDVIHRDIKPHNIVLDIHKNPIILDFGIAKSLLDDNPATQTGHILGSAHYMAPEQACQSQIDARTDIFGLGAVMYELWTGERPFKGDSMKDLILDRIKYQVQPKKYQPTSTRMIDPEIPKVIDKIIFKCLAPRPEDRFATARNLLEALEKVEQEATLEHALKMCEKKQGNRATNPWRESLLYPLMASLGLLLIGLLVTLLMRL